jgi:hypothetical protein
VLDCGAHVTSVVVVNVCRRRRARATLPSVAVHGMNAQRLPCEARGRLAERQAGPGTPMSHARPGCDCCPGST